MSRLKAYCPEKGYRYQILLYDEYNREYDHIDYAVDRKDKEHLMKEYHMIGGRYKVIELPMKYWKDEVK